MTLIPAERFCTGAASGELRDLSMLLLSALSDLRAPRKEQGCPGTSRTGHWFWVSSGARRWCNLPTELSALLTLGKDISITRINKQMPFLALGRLFLLCH